MPVDTTRAVDQAIITQAFAQLKEDFPNPVVGGPLLDLSRGLNLWFIRRDLVRKGIELPLELAAGSQAELINAALPRIEAAALTIPPGRIPQPVVDLSSIGFSTIDEFGPVDLGPTDEPHAPPTFLELEEPVSDLARRRLEVLERIAQSEGVEVGSLGDLVPDVEPEDISLGDKAIDFLGDVGGFVVDVGRGFVEAATGVDPLDPRAVGEFLGGGGVGGGGPDPTVLPGGGVIAPIDVVATDVPMVTGGGGVGTLGARGLFRITNGTQARPVQLVEGRHPVTGKTLFWQYAGRPLIFSRDLARLKATRKVGRRFASRPR